MTREERPGLTTSMKNAKKINELPEWRNWQTRWTQNPVLGDQGVGSTPSSGTIFPVLKSGSVSEFFWRNFPQVKDSFVVSLRPKKRGNLKGQVLWTKLKRFPLFQEPLFLD